MRIVQFVVRGPCQGQSIVNDAAEFAESIASNYPTLPRYHQMQKSEVIFSLADRTDVDIARIRARSTDGFEF
jgi:hypothetical protein